VLQHRRGHLFVCKLILGIRSDGSGPRNTLVFVTPLVDTTDLIDARDVAQILGLSQPGNVSLYQRRYGDMPRPVVNLGRGRCMLWLRPEIERWAAHQAQSGRTRPARRGSN
jgi:predicted DNA-binding transcriptional regulator AlpA